MRGYSDFNHGTLENNKYQQENAIQKMTLLIQEMTLITQKMIQIIKKLIYQIFQEDNQNQMNPNCMEELFIKVDDKEMDKKYIVKMEGKLLKK